MKISKNKIMIAVITALCAVVAGLVIYMVVGKNNKNNNKVYEDAQFIHFFRA